jgi:hypothetical protein
VGRAAPGKRTDEGKQQGHTGALGKDVNETAADSGNGRTYSSAKLFSEEPDALIGHVRVCGGSGWVTARFYPATKFLDIFLSRKRVPGTEFEVEKSIRSRG